ncbi:alanine racemase [Gloeobacter kilaueensis]|uniref:Alanine racemase n=1 Tax=Gloeobacter kilaueensis (strain ATCC BAA-2537 / CCAP 1431/1 / ULC 316 / JS1) TaxID=1183438 RepID=U5QD59_GLOK1|nr:alanine racemase [Gloeobacter kilaueensis]AGY56842.1 alanine racemase [Gloeobacter kilaueensis JS1]
MNGLDATRRAWVEIDLDALRQNVQHIRSRLAGRCRLLAVIKADAYGHGAVAAGEAALAAGADCLGVATLEEGIQLREAGLGCAIVVLSPIHTPAEVKAVAHWRLEPTLCTPRQVLVCGEHLARPHPIHLKIDTGMGRLGAPWSEAVAFVRLARSQPQLQIASLYSHLATADEPDSAALAEQHRRFEQVLAALKQEALRPACVHLANSAAALGDPSLHYDLVRVGMALYGLYPAPIFCQTVPLQPVMQVRARITQVKDVPAGTGVSYGHTYRTTKDARLATVAIGYADGVPRRLSNRMEALLHGTRVPQVGTITMDQLLIDCSQLPQAREGDIVTLIGSDAAETIGADDWATRLETIAYEIVCGFKHRLPRIVRAASPSPRPPEGARSEESV